MKRIPIKQLRRMTVRQLKELLSEIKFQDFIHAPSSPLGIKFKGVKNDVKHSLINAIEKYFDDRDERLNLKGQQLSLLGD